MNSQLFFLGTLEKVIQHVDEMSRNIIYLYIPKRNLTQYNNHVCTVQQCRLKRLPSSEAEKTTVDASSSICHKQLDDGNKITGMAV